MRSRPVSLLSRVGFSRTWNAYSRGKDTRCYVLLPPNRTVAMSRESPVALLFRSAATTREERDWVPNSVRTKDKGENLYVTSFYRTLR